MVCAWASARLWSASHRDPSATLLAMDVDPDLARGAVRISLGVENTTQQVQEFLAAIATVVDRLRRLTAVAV